MPELLKKHALTLKNIATAKNIKNADQKITLLAVSKTKPSSMIRTLFGAGQADFGENYLQEAIEKQKELADLAINWHYIGSIQRNKTRDIANHFQWVHTVERTIIAKRLSDQRQKDLPALNVCIQVNIDAEASKSGCLPSEVADLAASILRYDNLHLRGLMVLPSKAGSDAFARTQALFYDTAHTLSAKNLALPHWDTLSMGMSADYADAIAYGATMIRVGSAIFGERA